MQISARLSDWPKEQPAVTCDYKAMTENPTLEELIEAFGKDVVASKAVDSIVIDVQALMRRQLRAKEEKDRTPEAIQAKLDGYKPSASTNVRRSASDRAEELIGKMSAEEKEALIAKLRGEVEA